MADYWKSNAKFWCKFCRVYITDNKITRKTHDAGTKHKENVERFLREQDQRGRDKIADEAKLKKEMEAIEKAAQLQYQKDIEAGLIAPPPGGFPAASSSKGATAAAVESTSLSKGASTPTPASPAAAADKRASSSSSKDESSSPKPAAAVEVRDETVGQPGQWQTVERPSSHSNKRSRNDVEKSDNKKQDQAGPRLSRSVEGADVDDEVEDPEDLREFKLVEKTWPGEKPAFDEDGASDGIEGSGGSMFKKRRGNAAKTRNIRKKT